MRILIVLLSVISAIAAYQIDDIVSARIEVGTFIFDTSYIFRRVTPTKLLNHGCLLIVDMQRLLVESIAAGEAVCNARRDGVRSA